MTLNEAIYDIRNAIRQYADDSSIDNREIIFEINKQRAIFLKNKYNQGIKHISPTVIQPICMDVELADADECDCADSGCFVMRTVEKLPSTLDLNKKEGVTRVSGVNILNQSFSFVSQDKAINSGHNRFTKTNSIYSFLHPNGHIYIKSYNKMVKMLECIVVHAILENPLDAEPFNTGDYCFDYDKEYPMKLSTDGYIFKMIVNRFLMQLGIPEDIINNANNDDTIRTK